MKKLFVLLATTLSACSSTIPTTDNSAARQKFNVMSWWSVSSGPNESVDPQFIRGMHPVLISGGYKAWLNLPGWDDQKTPIEREIKFNTNGQSDGVVFWLPFGHFPDEDFDFAAYTESLKDPRLNNVTNIPNFVQDLVDFLQKTKLKKIYFYYGYVGAHASIWSGLTSEDKKNLIFKNLEPIRQLKLKADSMGVKVGILIDTLSQRLDPNDDNWAIAIPAIKSLGMLVGGEPWPNKQILNLEDPNFLNVFLGQSTWLFDPDFDTTNGTWNTWSAKLGSFKQPLSAIEFRDWTPQGYTDTPAIFLDKTIYGLKKYHSISIATPDAPKQTAESLKKLANQDGTNCVEQHNLKNCCTTHGNTITCINVPTTTATQTQAIAWSPFASSLDNFMLQGHVFVPGDTQQSRAAEIDKIMAQPEGHHALWVQNFDFDNDPKDRCSEGVHRCPWFDGGVETEIAWIKNFTKEAHAKGLTKLDYWVFDSETGNFSNWVTCASDGTDKTWLKAVATDPRFPELQKEGLTLTADQVPLACEFWDHRAENIVWNVFINDHYAQYWKKVWAAIEQEWPGIKIGGWGWYNGSKEQPLDFNCWPYEQRMKNMMPNHADFIFYGQMLHADCLDPANGLNSPLPQDSFHSLLYQLNMAIAGIRAGSTPFTIWIPNQHWNAPTNPMDSDVWYKEMVLHALLLGADYVSFWNPQPPYGVSDDAQERKLSSIMKEFDSFVGYADKKSLVTTMIPWDATTLKSCMKADGKTFCRVTDLNGHGVWQSQ